MGDHLTLLPIGLTIAVALFACYPLAKWIGRQRTLRAAERIARSFATEQVVAQASPALREKLERYRLAKVRSNLGAARSLHAAATELVRELRLYALEHR
ncbi:MAG TPA: hypothetical protein VLD36_12930 [Burkholderiales bacterium]|nr:hypothetical protein [Burkholderiales bacterium]